MTSQDALPFSRFQPRPFAEHPSGTLLIIASWASEPAELCLAVKLSGLIEQGKPIESALIIQGSPYGRPENCAGDIISDVGEGARYLNDPIPGLQGGSTRVDIHRGTRWDLRRQEAWRNVRGCAVLSALGARICGGGGGLQRMYSWGVAIDPATWSVNDQISNVHVMGVASDWLFVWEDGDQEVAIPVRAAGFQVADAPSPQER